MRLVRNVLLLAFVPSWGATASPSVPPASIQEFNDRLVQQLSKRIEGREDQPAERVFKNIKLEWLKRVRAKQLLDIMNGGYARALGVRCTHCHVEDDFASDDKRPKRAAREMATMHWDINQRLAKMGNLDSAPEDRFINCATCHRGAADPNASQRNKN
jgi:Photosynthetic reaction centre cytochrome C subunit